MRSAERVRADEGTGVSASVPPRTADERDLRRPPDLGMTIGVLVAIIAAVMPITGVIRSGPWLLGTVLLSATILAVGYVARRYRLAAVAVTLLELAAWALALTLFFFSSTALLWIFPTPATVRAVGEALATSSNEIALGAAPLEAGHALAFLIVGSTALLVIIIDHVVLTARMPLLAAVGLIAVSLIPSIAVPRGVDVPAFVLLAGAVLFLIRAETRAREPKAERAASRSRGVTATALGIGAIAVVVAIVAAPLLPQPAIQPGGGIGVGPGIDVSLQLGDDLRQPRETVVLSVHTTLPTAPYLRAATLSRFDGGLWNPDRARSVPLTSDLALSEVTADPDIRVAEYTTSVEVKNLVSPWLLVPFPAVGVTGLAGDWEAVPFNRTVISRQTSTAGQRYEVVTHVPRPSLEQIRATSANGADIADETRTLPGGMPPIIEETAVQVTAGAGNDYDRLAMLQRWFRSSGEFTYSLDSPVEERFDGSGAQAVARFLEVREGYCVHFASAFALMARTLGMPSRIVVGYLPGTATTAEVDGQSVYQVSSSQQHAWPEVYFEGIGWIAFEPTVSLGTPTMYAPAATLADNPGEGVDVEPAPSASASALDPRADEDIADQGVTDAGAASANVNPLPTFGIVLGVLAALAIPALVQGLRTRRLLGAARRGDTVAAWTVVQDAAIDLGIPSPASDSPRSLGHRLIQRHGAPLEATTRLVSAIERASYAPHNMAAADGTMADAAAAVRAGLLADVSSARRARAVLIPRSLVVRPGSLYAGAGARATIVR